MDSSSSSESSSAAGQLIAKFVTNSENVENVSSTINKSPSDSMSVADEVKLWSMVDDGLLELIKDLLHDSYSSMEETTCRRIAKLLVCEEEDALHGTVLMAVDANVPHLVSVLLRRVQKKHWSESSRSSKFRLKNVSPLMLACHNNFFNVVAILLSRDHKLPVPHNIKCVCEECVEWRQKDSLNRSKYITNLCRAICSPAFLWLACPDPLSAASKLAYEMGRQANDNPEYRVVLRQCSESCRQFCGSIAKMLNKSTEIDIILTSMQPMYMIASASKHPGLELAIACNIKDFIVDPGVSAHIKSYWLGSNADFGVIEDSLKIMAHIFYPFTAPIYILSAGNWFPTYQVPFYRFVSYATSYMVFLVLLVLLMDNNDNSIAGWPHEKWKVAGQFYTWFYLFGLVASDIETVNVGTFSKFIEAWWHCLDMMALGIYMLSFFVWLRSELCTEYLVEVHRSHWAWFEPRLVFEVTFSFATMLSFWRLFYYFQLSKTFGPHIISIGRCARPIMIYISIIVIETFAFSVAINSVYENYAGNSVELPDGSIDKSRDYFTSVLLTTRWMYWTFYNYLHPKDIGIVVGNAGTAAGGQIHVTRHKMASWTGELLIGLYVSITIVILLKLMIAVMTGIASKITANSDEEWIWERANIWHEFMQIHFTLPSPFNTIHIAYLKLSSKFVKRGDQKPQTYSNTEYESLMEELLLRYLARQERK